MFFDLRLANKFKLMKNDLPVISKLAYNIGRSSNFMGKANACSKF